MSVKVQHDDMYSEWRKDVNDSLSTHRKHGMPSSIQYGENRFITGFYNKSFRWINYSGDTSTVSYRVRFRKFGQDIKYIIISNDETVYGVVDD